MNRSRFDPVRWLGRLYLSACNRVGAGTHALGRPLVHNDGRIEIGRGVTLRSHGSPVRLVATRAGSIAIGDDVLIDAGTHIFSCRSVRIGDGVVIGPNVIVSDRDEGQVAGETVVEPGVRVGTGACLIGPCRIGRGAVVLPGTTVRSDIPAGAIAGGQKGDLRVNGTSVNGTSTPARAREVPASRVNAVLAADSTIAELAEHLQGPTEDGLVVEAEVAPFDQVVQTLVALRARQPKPDLAVVWTRPERVCPSFANLLQGRTPDQEETLAEVDAFAGLLRSHADAARFVFVPSWVLPPSRRGTGMLELRGARATALLMRMNLRLADALADLPNVFLLDAQRWLATATDGGFDPKLWHAGKIAFTTGVFREAARDMQAALRGLLGMSRKLIVVDLDDTLWGGIVGDVGWENLRIGGPEADGEAFAEFQRQLLALASRGIALAVVSKNEESTALEAMRRHPEMIIRPEALAGYRISWRDKAQGVAEIAGELNLGLQSVVFLDDNPVERGRVREALPQVYVPDWPPDPTHYPRALEALRCFDAPHVSAEDLERNALYAKDRERNSQRSTFSSIDEWLTTLDLTVRFERLGPANAARAAQLLNKTNQMNLRTRRLSEGELLEWSRQEGHEVWAVHVSDRFGNAGLTGLLGLARNGQDVHVTDFVLSCRVMGRRVEETMLWASTVRAMELGASKLVFSPIATPKNKPCIDFFSQADGLTRGDQGYVALPGEGAAPPRAVSVEGLS